MRIAHLHDYAWQDRSQSGQPVDLKPEEERAALLEALGTEAADLLILRGLGSEASLQHLQEALRAAGTPYPYAEYVPGPDAYEGIGFLSHQPFSEARNLSQEVFRIKERSYQPLAGGIRISTPDFPRLWIWNQKAPPPGESYERRRNDARILTQHLRPLLESGAEILLSLHSREDMDSPMLRMLEETGLQRLLIRDGRGDSWTHRDPDGILYRQDQWIFVTPALHARLSGAEVMDSEAIRAAGPYRHQQLRLP